MVEKYGLPYTEAQGGVGRPAVRKLMLNVKRFGSAF
jgi:hypothetical protein